jgi:endoglucanase
MSGPPYQDYWAKLLHLSTEPQAFQFEFDVNAPSDPTVELAFHLGGSLAPQVPLRVCFDDLVLSDAQFNGRAGQKSVQVPKIRVNQLGYFPALSKLAVLVNPSQEPVAFEVKSPGGQLAFSGKSQVVGNDKTSGDNVHLLDFSGLTTPGKDYVLYANGALSDAFDVSPQLYSKLSHDAFKYFYQNRSGIALAQPFTEGAAWVRPAGDAPDKPQCTEGTECNYQLDVSKGWYDAGDYGKYVVNGGIAVWTLLNLAERGKGAVIPDGQGNIPESGNGIDDLLDEVRWQLDFMLAMQVPEGQPLAGMVHHKVHANDWSSLGHAPHAEGLPRVLHRPSTAATLNLAASSAQASRVFQKLDPAFSKRLLRAAELAYRAAKLHPDLLIKATENAGGGAYDDPNVDDEFYWAASELWLTTGNPAYGKAVTESSLDAAISEFSPTDPKVPAALTWQKVDVAAKLSLAQLSTGNAKARYQRQITSLAGSLMQHAEAEGYRLPHAPSTDGRYIWGSNSFVLNNGLILASAYDFSHDERFLSGTVWALDYLLGRNALGQSYVTGYGERAANNPHHRFWAYQADPRFPKPPPGAVVGGPNSDLQDPYVKAAGRKGCAPQKCYIDHIEAWSQNEIAINWNAPLFWLSQWLNTASANKP